MSPLRDPSQPIPPNILRAMHRAPALKTYGPNNPDPRLPDTQQRECAEALAGSHRGEAQSPGCPLVRFTLCRVQLLDVDAKWGSVKDLLDGLRYAGLIRGDKEGEISLEVRQERVGSYKEEKTVIEIEARGTLSGEK